MSCALSFDSPPQYSGRQQRRTSSGTLSLFPATDIDSSKRVSFHSDVDVKQLSASVPSLIPSDTAINNAILLAEEAKEIFSKLKTIPEANFKSIDKINQSYMTSAPQGRFFGLDALQDLDTAVNGGGSFLATPSPSESSSSGSNRKKKSSKMGPPQQDSLRRMAVENNYHYDQPSDGSRRRGQRDSDFMSTTEETSSERIGSYSNNNSPYRTPARTYFTDTEILRSPSEVLYMAKGREDENDYGSNTVHSSSQTLQSQLSKRRDSHPHIYDSYLTSKRRGSNPVMSQSLDGYIEEDKENSYKTRIHVISPERGTGTDASGRKPYKTTINTATDNIHYRQEAGFYDAHGHYKVPRNKPLYNMRYQATDSDSSARYYTSRRNSSDVNNNPNHFASTRLVKNIETSRNDRDREGREIFRRNGRTYSGCSTSPDREGSIERYSRPKPVRSYSNLTYHSLHRGQDRSPSSSPSRPIRSKSSHQGREERPRSHHNHRPSSKSHRKPEESNERLSKFTEYRGREDEYSNYESVTSNSSRRRSSVVAHNNKYNEELARGQSLPPGATIDSIGDFYKSNQYKSMYTLPPSPNRPAPILDRVSGGSNGTLNRRHPEPEGLYTDDSSSTKISRPKLKDPKRRAPSPPRHYTNGAKIQIKRGGESEPGSNPRRVHHPNSRRTTAYSQRRRQSVDGTLDSSYSESDGMVGDNDQNSPGPPWSSSLSTDDLNEEQEDLIEKEIAGVFSEKLSSRAPSLAHLSTISSPLIRNPNTAIIRLHPHKDYHQNANLPVAFTKVKRGGGAHVMFYDDKVMCVEDRPIKKDYGPGRRYVSASGNSDLDSDYRRELATHSRPSSTLLSRSKKGSTSNLTTKSLDRRYRERHPVPGEIKRRLSPPSREEERRKVLEIERIHRQKTQLQQEQETPRSTPSRSGSRLGRVLGIGGGKKTRHLSSDGDSQYTAGGGRSSPKPPVASSASTPRSNSVPKINRYDQNTRGVKRNTSSSHGVRREIHNRKKIPGSLTSSINSSESEGTAGTTGKAIILHNTAVAEIPVPRSDRRTVSESRENISSRRGNGGSNANLQKSQKISRSISLLTPWKPRNYKDKFEGPRGKSPGKPPRPPSASRNAGPSSRTGTMLRESKKSASSSDLLRDDGDDSTRNPRHPSRASSRMENPEPLPPSPSAETSPSNPAANSKVSRSVSMPKNSRLSGWFKKRK